MTKLAIVLTSALAITMAGAHLHGQSGYDLFQKALAAERAAGNLREAIRLYEQVVKQFSNDRPLAARALIRLAECHQKLGDADARQFYERVVREFADQRDAAAEARARLAALSAQTSTAISQTVRLVWIGPEAFGSVRGTISPDGRYLTFLDVATGALAIRDLKENTSRTLAQASDGSVFYAVFSPDGRRVAYTWATRSGRDIQFDLRVLSAAGSEGAPPRIVYRNEEMIYPRPFGWTPDGKHLLVLRSLKDGTNQITLIGVEDGSARVLKSVPWNYTAMSLSPDGRYIAYESLVGTRTSPAEIFVLATDGSRETRAVQSPGVNSSPVWTPDGSRLLFLSDRTGTSSLWSVAIEDGRPTGQPALIRADLGRVRLQGITRSGTLLYLAAGVTRANVYLADLDTSGKAAAPPAVVSQRFINSNSAPTWSPDGQSLAYLSSRGQGGTVLVIRSTNTGEERDLPLPKEMQTGNLVPGPRWFPDGRALLVFGFLANGRGLYYRVDAASGRVEVIHEASGVSGNGGLGSSAISNDGNAIFYIASPTTPYQGETNLIRFDIDSKRETILTSGTFNAVAISPDGTQIALHTVDGTSAGCRLQVMPSSGGELREVVRACIGVGRLGWSPTNELLYVTGGNRSPNIVWRVPPSGGEPRQMGISMPGQLEHPELSPDGRRLTFAVFDTGSSEVWALENFLPQPSTKR